MSYGSTFVQFEANGRISQKFSRPNFKKDETHDNPKLVHYEKQFDVNLSRVEDQTVDKSSVRASMLNYSQKMRTLQDARYSSGNGKGDTLFVRAKHIPKYPVRAPKKRRPMSFDELLGRDRETGDRPGAAKARPHSDKTKPLRDVETKSDNELHLPLLTERLKKSAQSVQVSLVSASDLYDIVDFTLRSKGTRKDSLQRLRIENEVKNPKLDRVRDKVETEDSIESVFPDDTYNRFERTVGRFPDRNRKLHSMKNVQKLYDSYYNNSHMPSDEFYQETFAMDKSSYISPETQNHEQTSYPFKLPSINNEPFKRRPTRAKRMKLIDPGLGDIPEDHIIESHASTSRSRREQTRTQSPTPQKPGPKLQDMLDKISLDAIQETAEKVMLDEHVYSNPANKGQSQSIAYNSDTQHNETFSDEGKSSKTLLHDDGDVRIEVTQCPPKHETVNTKLKAQKRIKKLIYLRDAPR